METKEIEEEVGTMEPTLYIRKAMEGGKRSSKCTQYELIKRHKNGILYFCKKMGFN